MGNQGAAQLDASGSLCLTKPESVCRGEGLLPAHPRVVAGLRSLWAVGQSPQLSHHVGVSIGLPTAWQLASPRARNGAREGKGRKREGVRKREQPRRRPRFLYNLISEATFCFILFIRRESLHPALTQGEGTARECEELVRVTGSHAGGWLHIGKPCTKMSATVASGSGLELWMF